MRAAVAVWLAFDRETSIIAALVALGVAGLVVSAGAWILLARERRRHRGQDRSAR